MAAPSGVVLLAYGTHLYSHINPSGAVSGWLSVGTSPSGYLPGALIAHNDGVLGTYSAANEITAAFAVDCRAAVTPLFAGFFNHNFTAGVVKIQGSNASDFSTLIVDEICTVASPNFWKDLRNVTPRTARYWRGLITGNGNAAKLGEFVVADASAMQYFQWEYEENRDYLEYTQGSTEHGTFHRQKQAITVRGKVVRWVGPDSVAELLARISWFVGRRPSPVVLIPDDAETDIWLLDWVDEFIAGQVIENRQEVRIALQEQSPGSLS